MAGLALAYEARSYSMGVAGRSICNARNHHWVAENTGGDAVGLASCSAPPFPHAP